MYVLQDGLSLTNQYQHIELHVAVIEALEMNMTLHTSWKFMTAIMIIEFQIARHTWNLSIRYKIVNDAEVVFNIFVFVIYKPIFKNTKKCQSFG